MQSHSTTSDLFGEPTTPTKRCKICKEHFPLDQFYHTTKKNGRRYPDSYCKACGKKNRRNYKPSRPSKKWLRMNNLRKFGLTVEQYDAMFAAQEGVCAICGCEETHVSPYTKGVRRLCVDHDHKTGKVRGIICSKCNRGIGILGDNLPRLRAVLAYLEAHNKLQDQEG